LPFGDFSGLGVTPSGGIVGLDRFFVGGGGQYNYSDNLFARKNRLTIGFDIDSQMDERVNYTNVVDSIVIGPKSLDQDEDVFSWGIFLQNEFSITDSLGLTAGIRYDEVEYDFTDNYFVDGTDDSGDITFTEWSPQVGLLWSVNNAVNIYGNIGTSFEPPSSREFANPTAAGGFNPNLKAQTATNYEIGVKGFVTSKFNYELAIFRIETDDELVLAGQNPAGSDFFINAGETTRNGVEAAMTVKPLQGLDLSLAYTYSDFEFDEFTVGGTSFEGNALPGIPEQMAYVELAYYHPSGFYSIWDTQFVDQVYVDNANSDAAGYYTISNYKLGYEIDLGNKIFTPFLGVNNIFDRNYFGAVRVNESNSRFFEPAPELNFYAGMSLRFQ
jgi:iron complex outermembrane receptor protein